MRYWMAATLLMAGAGTAEAQATQIVGDLPRREGRTPERTEGVETELGVVTTSDGVRLRSFVTRPAGAEGRLPAVFLTQWVSCGSIEFPPDRDTDLRLIARTSGLVTIRVDRAGSGDSEGPGCDALDYDTEVRHYREALDQLTQHRWIDPARIVIYGSSLGATTAPLVAEGRKVAGVMVQGGGAVTHLERMINFDRIALERGGTPPDAIHDEMLKRIAFHQLYLGGLTPPQVIDRRPDLAGVWERMRGTAEMAPHYGRPYAWHWQAAKRNFLAAWAKTDAPVLVLYAEYDQFEPRHGHQLIADTVNRLRPGTAIFVEVPGVDHSLVAYPSMADAYADKLGARKRDAYLPAMIAWLRRVTGLPPR